MKTLWGTGLGLVLGIATWSAHAQGTFQNLGFESATIVPVQGDPYQRIDFAAAFPGWTGRTGANQEHLALHNGEFLDSSGIALIEKSYNSGSYVSRGNYAVMLQAGFGLWSEPLRPADASLSQTGLVPVGSQSLLFDALFYSGLSPTSFDVTLGGQTLALTPLSTTGGFTLYGADVHALAGQTVQLDFVLHAADPHIGNAALLIDAIRFSTQPIPEPSALGLVGLGALAFAFFVNRRSRVARREASNSQLSV